MTIAELEKIKETVDTISTKNIGAQIKKRREELGITQAHFSEILDIDISTLSRIECGIRLPNLPTYLKLCLALNIPLYELIEYPSLPDSSLDAEQRQILSTDLKTHCTAILQIADTIAGTNTCQ